MLVAYCMDYVDIVLIEKNLYLMLVTCNCKNLIKEMIY